MIQIFQLNKGRKINTLLILNLIYLVLQISLNCLTAYYRNTGYPQIDVREQSEATGHSKQSYLQGGEIFQY